MSVGYLPVLSRQDGHDLVGTGCHDYYHCNVNKGQQVSCVKALGNSLVVSNRADCFPCKSEHMECVVHFLKNTMHI